MLFLYIIDYKQRFLHVTYIILFRCTHLGSNISTILGGKKTGMLEMKHISFQGIGDINSG